MLDQESKGFLTVDELQKLMTEEGMYNQFSPIQVQREAGEGLGG